MPGGRLLLSLAALACASAACGRRDFAVLPDRADGSLDGSLDASLPEPTEPWQTSQELTGLNTGSDDSDPDLRGDGLELFFHSNRPGMGGWDLYHSLRASTADLFTTASPLDELNTPGDDLGPCITPDGLTLYFSDGSDIVYATRPTLLSPFGPRTPLPELSSADVDTAPELSADGLTAVVVRGTVGTRDLWVYSRSAPGAPSEGWGSAVTTAASAPSFTDSSPDLDARGLILTFHSDRIDGVNDDIFVATRSSTSVDFGSPTIIGVISTPPGDEGDPTISGDRRTMVFHRELQLQISKR